jgi:hypothetical protein
MGWKLHDLPVKLRAQIEDAMAPRVKEPTVKPLGPGPDRESDLHDDILRHCRDNGWLCVHSRMDRRSTNAVGTPDFIIVTPGTVLFVEAKMPGKKLRPEQRAFAAHIRKLGWPHATVHTFTEFLEVVGGSE